MFFFQVMHYVEKPSTFVSTIINCGIYLCSLEIFPILAAVFKQKQQDYYNGLSIQSFENTYICCIKNYLSLCFSIFSMNLANRLFILIKK